MVTNALWFSLFCYLLNASLPYGETDPVHPGNARIEDVGKSQSCMVSKGRTPFIQGSPGCTFRTRGCGTSTGAWPYNRPCAQQYVGKSQSCMVLSGRLIVHAPVDRATERGYERTSEALAQPSEQVESAYRWSWRCKCSGFTRLAGSASAQSFSVEWSRLEIRAVVDNMGDTRH